MPETTGAPTPVYCYPADRNSAYVPLLFEGIEEAYAPIYRQDGSLRDAIARIDAGATVIVHVHWEEFVLRDCRSEAEANTAAAAFIFQITALSERRAPIIWTVHNELPHEIPYRSQFLDIRAALARCADRILVHNTASVIALEAQAKFDTSNVRILPHPSYLGRFEDEATLQAGLNEAHRDRRIQAFGWIRRQKALNRMIDMLSAEYLHSRDAYIRISGDGPEAQAIAAERPERSDVRWDIRHVPNIEIPVLLRSAACVILPYERVLTSGVALLATSAGAIVVAVDFPQLRELLPSENHRFLYAPGDGDSLRRIVDFVLALSASERRAIAEANLSVARESRTA